MPALPLIFCAFVLQLQPGRYTAQLQGARLELTVATLGGKLTVTRSFYEPGQVLHRKTYINVRPGKEGMLEATGTRIKPPKDAKSGPVVLETSSGVAAIPANLWIQYGPVQLPYK